MKTLDEMVDRAENCLPFADQRKRLRPFLRQFAEHILFEVALEMERAAGQAIQHRKEQICDPEYDAKKRKRIAARRLSKKGKIPIEGLAERKSATKAIQ